MVRSSGSSSSSAAATGVGVMTFFSFVCLWGSGAEGGLEFALESPHGGAQGGGPGGRRPRRGQAPSARSRRARTAGRGPLREVRPPLSVSSMSSSRAPIEGGSCDGMTVPASTVRVVGRAGDLWSSQRRSGAPAGRATTPVGSYSGMTRGHRPRGCAAVAPSLLWDAMEKAQRLIARVRSLGPGRQDLLLAGVLSAGTVVEMAVQLGTSPRPWLTMVTGLTMTGGVALRRRAPVTMAVVAVVALAVFERFAEVSDWM